MKSLHDTAIFYYQKWNNNGLNSEEIENVILLIRQTVEQGEYGSYRLLKVLLDKYGYGGYPSYPDAEEHESEYNTNDDGYITCLVCGYKAFVHDGGFYECSVCGHSGWEGECATDYPAYKKEQVDD